ncbi:uncharacterized protein LOC113358814 [Papaver somniferum]|uniref:uncharacterized protein LOC113358814 n=1 Tax=Papaver somniferum TaxID=3469 RepID=UPI000E704ADC|nr:uncharacterized protein LOC113358814 [Papaver somniferum]XP_026458290.1 uncharacterized protein LOC113358814 [Papaver somniferum]XP_026458291.1 uncharacterized protein LOC113358814 [Papaver somniferum]XP_026458292.1 uncharacterized protein LOC113358814 [Papaver somniferum]XP_026458293.1 uncharacterized protein LOC113358814 [Papaver somniferum]XP_026458294.1 uncharacterized protein LOC113358814 [Papaver somniferum]XP_026458295.1 uncharacterized protein LOC113358814 [Papaver somniferum]XP_0
MCYVTNCCVACDGVHLPSVFYGILVIPIVAELPPKDGAIEVILEDYHRRASSLLSIATMSACCQVSIPLGLQALYNKMQATIRVDPTAKKTEKAAPTMHKRPFGSLQVENQMQLVFGDGEAKPTVQGSKRCICDNRWTDLTQSKHFFGVIIFVVPSYLFDLRPLRHSFRFECKLCRKECCKTIIKIKIDQQGFVIQEFQIYRL